jgi:hypothetical protein
MRDGMDVSAREALLTRTRECICMYRLHTMVALSGTTGVVYLVFVRAEMQADCVLGIGRWDLPGLQRTWKGQLWQIPPGPGPAPSVHSAPLAVALTA